MSWSDYITKQAERLKWDDKRMALELGVAASTIQRWKAGQATPHPLMNDLVRQFLDYYPSPEQDQP